MNKITTLDYWIKMQGPLNVDLDSDDLILEWLNHNFEFDSIDNVLEIGCFPGRYLTIFGQQNIELYGMDYIEDVNYLSDIFKKKNFRVGEFYNCDFFDFNPGRKFDCVMSLGFIEHFKDWESVLNSHFSILNDGGYLIIEVPNFKGFFQRIPRILFDYKNYKNHNIKSMNLKKWEKILIDNNFEIVYSGYFGGYLLWFDFKSEKKMFNFFKKITTRILEFIQSSLYKNKAEGKQYSCAMGIIAKRNQ